MITARLAIAILKRLVVLYCLIMLADTCYRPYWEFHDYQVPMKYADRVTVSLMRSPLSSIPSQQSHWSEQAYFYDLDVSRTALSATHVVLTSSSVYVLLSSADLLLLGIMRRRKANHYDLL